LTLTHMHTRIHTQTIIITTMLYLGSHTHTQTRLDLQTCAQTHTHTHTHTQTCRHKHTRVVHHQVHGDAGPDAEPCVDVDGMAAVLRDLGQPGQRRGDGERKHQNRLQQLGAV